jgi:sulfur carrier protein
MINIVVNSQVHSISPDTSVLTLLAQLGHTGKRLAVERNGAIVPRSAHESTLLQTGDALEIVIAVGGG